MNGMVSLITPLLLHMIVSEITAALLGSRFDSAVCTSVAALLVIPAAGFMYFRDRQKQAGAESDISPSVHPVLFGIFCFLAGIILNLIWSGILNMFHITSFFSNTAQERLLASGAAVQIIGLGVLVPVAEELVFRGLIYTRMKRFLPVRISVFLSALLFAVYHGNPIQMIFAFPMSIALAAVFERGKLFVFPLLFHMGANLMAVFANFF